MENGPRRIGMLGGTFNPVHMGHIAMATGVRIRFGLEEVLLVTAQDPPHKQVDGHVPAFNRLEMTQLAAGGLDGVHACDIEINRPGKSYTADTLRQLQELYPGAQLFIIVGSDMLKDLPTWHNAPALFRMAALLAVPRKGQSAEDEQAAQLLREQYGADVRLADIDVPQISSTQVRAHVEQGLPITGLVPAAVEQYIYQNGLYLPEPVKRVQEKCRASLNTNRYRHTMGVVRMAIALAQRYGEDTQKARLAALLHDCARDVDKGALTHAATGERIAREEYGVTDEEVLRAIRRHTTLGPDATRLDKIVYLADMVEPGRKYRGVGELRALAMHDLDAAAAKGLRDTIAFVQQRGQPVHPDSLAALRGLGGNLPPET